MELTGRLSYLIFIAIVAGDMIKSKGKDEKKPMHPKLAAFNKNAHLRPTRCQGSNPNLPCYCLSLVTCFFTRKR